MAGEKPTMILKSKTDMTFEEIAELSDSEAWKLIYSLHTTKTKDDRLQVCFTGFGDSKKEQLKKLAEDKNFKVVFSVTKDLFFLVGDENAGPKKIAMALAKGAHFLSEQQFILFIDTGEVPDNFSE